MLKTVGDPVFGDSCADDQFGHSVLILVLSVSTLLSFPHSLRVKVLERVDCLRWSWQLLFSNLLEMLFSTSTFSEKSIVDADLSKFDFELVGGLGLGSHSVGVDDGLGHLLNPGSLGAHHVNVVLGVLGVGEGSGASFLLLHVTPRSKLHAVHLCGNILRLGTDILENVDPRVCSDLDLAFCAVSAFFAIWYFSASSTFMGLGVGEGGGRGNLLVVVGKGVGCDQLLLVICEGVGVDDLLVVNSGGDSSDSLHVVAIEGVSCDELLGSGVCSSDSPRHC